jgi:Putative Ig domain
MATRACLTFAMLLCCCEWLPARSLAIRTRELPWAIKGAPYQSDLITTTDGRCPTSDVRLSITAGELPKGLELYSFGIQGTPTQMGHFRFTLRAANACSTDIRMYDLLVTGKPILMAFPSRIDFQYRAGSEVSLQDVIRVEGSWPDLPYAIDMAAAPWLKVEPAAGKTPDSASALSGDRVRLRIDPAKLPLGVYRTALKFYTAGGENVPIVDVTLQISAPDSDIPAQTGSSQ